MKVLKSCFSVFLILLISGCDSYDRQIKLREEIDNLEIEKRELNTRLEQCKEQTRKLKQQIKTLSEIRAEGKFEKIYDLRTVNIGRYTGLYDKNDDGIKEKLIVYIQPIDQNGDIIKAPGKVQVQLWDLQKSSEEAKLEQWEIPPEKLAKNWFSTVIFSNYRLTFDVSGVVERFDHPLTVKLEFTDYCTGKVFNKQKVIKP